MKGRDFFRQQRKGKDVIQLGQGVQFVFRCSVVPNIKGVSSKEPQMLQGQEKSRVRCISSVGSPLKSGPRQAPKLRTKAPTLMP